MIRSARGGLLRAGSAGDELDLPLSHNEGILLRVKTTIISDEPQHFLMFLHGFCLAKFRPTGGIGPVAVRATGAIRSDSEGGTGWHKMGLTSGVRSSTNNGW